MVMREEATWMAEEYCDNQLEGAMQKLVDDGKWKMCSRTKFPKYFNDTDGLLFIFQIL